MRPRREYHSGMSAARLTFVAAGLVAAATAFAIDHLARAPRADACGCFAPPDPTVPVVQSAERILFGIDDGVVTAHVQIQYSGDAAEFAWLVPLPAVPSMSLGTDELFAQLVATTQPTYRVGREYGPGCPIPPAPPPPAPGIGPYDYAVLDASSRQPMLDWLADNGFFVPAGTDDAVVPYIRDGAYFLALKLQSGQSTGDLQPVVLRYASALPMVPIVLTSVAA